MNYPVSAPASNSRPYRLYVILSLILILAAAIGFGGYKIVFFAAEAEPVKNVNSVARQKIQQKQRLPHYRFTGRI
jgi:hypothetical protein